MDELSFEDHSHIQVNSSLEIGGFSAWRTNNKDRDTIRHSKIIGNLLFNKVSSRGTKKGGSIPRNKANKIEQLTKSTERLNSKRVISKEFGIKESGQLPTTRTSQRSLRRPYGKSKVTRDNLFMERVKYLPTPKLGLNQIDLRESIRIKFSLALGRLEKKNSRATLVSRIHRGSLVESLGINKKEKRTSSNELHRRILNFRSPSFILSKNFGGNIGLLNGKRGVARVSELLSRAGFVKKYRFN